MAWKQNEWRVNSCLKRRESTLKFLSLLFTVSCRALILLLYPGDSLSIQTTHLSPRYPLSATTRSFEIKRFLKISLKILISGYLPQGYGPLHHIMWPDVMATPNSYGSPGPLNLWLNHAVENGLSSKIRQSVPSTEIKKFVELPIFCEFQSI